MIGYDVLVTSGFVQAMGKEFEEFANIQYTTRKAIVKDYCYSKNCGINLSGKYAGEKPVLIPQLDFCTNDTWEIAAAFGTDNNFPIILSFSYGNGTVSVITIPDDMGDLYNYPREILTSIRNLFVKECGSAIDAPSNVQLFLYDNDYFILRSDLPYETEVKVKLPNADAKIEILNYNSAVIADMERVSEGEAARINGSTVTLTIGSGINYVCKISK